MTSIYQFIIYEASDPIHPLYAVQNATNASISYIDAYSFMNQVQQNSFLNPSITVNYVNAVSSQIIELQSSTLYYPIISQETGYAYYMNYMFSLCLSPQGKHYLYATQMYDNDWNWGDTYNIATSNTFLYIYRQPWSSLQNPYQNSWYLYKIIYNPPSPPTIDLLQTNQFHIIDVFEKNRYLSGSQIIPFSIAPLFQSHYDVEQNKAYQTVFPIHSQCSCSL